MSQSVVPLENIIGNYSIAYFTFCKKLDLIFLKNNSAIKIRTFTWISVGFPKLLFSHLII